MNAKVRGLWLIVECPHCNKPQVIHKHVMNNSIVHLIKTRFLTCEECEGNFFVELTQEEYPIVQ